MSCMPSPSRFQYFSFIAKAKSRRSQCPLSPSTGRPAIVWGNQVAHSQGLRPSLRGLAVRCGQRRFRPPRAEAHRAPLSAGRSVGSRPFGDRTARRRTVGDRIPGEEVERHVKTHLAGFARWRNTDGSAGFGALARVGSVPTVACVVLVRRNFFDVQVVHVAELRDRQRPRLPEARNRLANGCGLRALLI